MEALVDGYHTFQASVRAKTIETAQEARLEGLAVEDFSAGEAVKGTGKADS